MRYMEIAIVNKDTIKIKGKNVNFIVDPSTAITKTSADAVIFLTDVSDSTEQSAKVEGARVIIKGPGSYEVAGARISATKSDNDFFYLLNVDGLDVLVGRAREIEKQQDKGGCNILVLNVDAEFKESIVSSFEPSVVVIYGDGADAAVKSLGKEHQTLSKFSTAADKLPSDVQIILLK